MRIAVVFRKDVVNGCTVPCYAMSYVEAFREMGHEVEQINPGRECTIFGEAPDLWLEIENGRNELGELVFWCQQVQTFGHTGKRAVLLIDSHGHPDLHTEVAKSYDHVFFAVWARRDLFAGHPSAHWCPNATDLKWFGAERFSHITPEVDVGFFGSKKGLSRADDLVRICKANGWTYDVRQVASNRNPNRWPATGEAMARCRVLFNRGQKHDGPNQRVMESMAMGRPLVCDYDPSDGTRKLFEHAQHYISYVPSMTDLENSLSHALLGKYGDIGERARAEVEDKHTIKHRAQQILEVVCS
jgi:hypothetical protein